MDQNSNIDHGQFFITPEPLKSTRKFLPLGGGVLDGSIGYNPSKITIDTGAIDIGENSDQYAGFVILTSESGTTDTLTDINNFLLSYQSLKLQAASGHTITITTTGNIDLSSDITLTNQDTIELFFDIVDNTWKLMGGSGTSGISFPATPPVNILGTVTTAQDIVLSATTAHSTSLTLGASISLTFSSYPTTGTQIEWEVEVTQDATTAFVITWPAEVVNPPDASAYSTLGAVIVIVFRTNDAGTTVRVGNTITTGSSVSTWSNFTAISAVNFGGFASTNMSSLTMAGDIDVATFDVLQIDRATFAASEGVVTDVTISQLVLNSSNSFQFNTAAANDFVFTLGGNTLGTLENTVSNNGVLTIQSIDSTGGAFVDVFRNDTDGAIPATTIIGGIGLKTGTSTASTVAEYASIQAVAETVDASTFEGSLDLLAADGSGGQATFISINDGANNLVDIFKEMDMNTNKIVNVVDPTSAQDAATKQYVDDNAGVQSSIAQLNSNVTVTDTGSGLITTTVDGTQQYSIQDGRADYETIPVFGITNLTFFDSASAIGGVLTTNTSSFDISVPVSTDVISFTNVSTITANFTNTDLQLLSGTPNTLSAGLRLFRDDPSPVADDALGSIHFDGNDSAGNFTNYATWIGAIEVTTNGSEIGRMTLNMLDDGTESTVLQISQGALTVGKTSSVAAEVATLNLLKTDATPIASDDVGTLNFQVLDTGVTTTYGDITTAIIDATDNSVMTLNVRANNGLIAGLIVSGDDNNQRIMVRIGGTDQARIQPILGQMGYFVTTQVTDFSLVIGTSGSLEIPVITDGSPSVTDLNSAFGSFDGAIGYDDSDGTLYVRTSATVWSFYTRSGTIT